MFACKHNKLQSGKLKSLSSATNKAWGWGRSLSCRKELGWPQWPPLATIQSPHRVQMTMQAMPNSWSRARGTGLSFRYRSTQPTVMWRHRLEKSFMVATSTSQSTRIYLEKEERIKEKLGKCVPHHDIQPMVSAVGPQSRIQVPTSLFHSFLSAQWRCFACS